ncbi:hypothetical protein BGW37DRAFT_269596 [Umbelopsis sp. PMI_123]|nr:hypothetical protein BGW37DRAFT_269596 [Umbelopsis sp. PMI_123]
MASYLVTGASRGIGLEYVRQLSEDGKNTVIGLVRNAAKANFLHEISGRPNVHIVEGDITSIEKMQKAAGIVSSITGGSLDYIIENAGGNFGTNSSLAKPNVELPTLIEQINENFEVNAISGVITTNVFLPLLRKGKAKKIILISSALGDIDFTRTSEFPYAAPYGIAKVAVNFIVQKYAVELAEEGFVVIALSPGVVDVSSTKEGGPPQLTEEEMKFWAAAFEDFKKVAPDWDGKPLAVQDSVSKQLKVIGSLSPKDAGKMLSQNGNNVWT